MEESIRQKFDYIVVLDFGKIQFFWATQDSKRFITEATCDEKKNFGPQEIIEFPSIIINTKTLKVRSHPKIQTIIFFTLLSIGPRG